MATRFKSLCLVLLFPFFNATSAATEPVILIVGDSLSAGYGIDPRSGWVALLQQRLRDNGQPHRVVNASVSGETTRGGLARLPRAIEQHDPDIVVIELGANDGLRGLALEETERNLSRMTEISQAVGAYVILAGMQIPPNYGGEYTRQFRDMFPAVARRYGTGLIPFFLDGIALDDTLMQADRFHPNEDAQPIILETVWAVLEPAIEDQPSAVGGGDTEALRSEIILLGTGTPFPRPDRSGPAVMIRVDGVPYIIDAGPGVVRRAAAAFSTDDKRAMRAGVQQLRVAFITHLHSDHTLGYADLILTPWIIGRALPLDVYGPKGLRAMTDNLMAAYSEDIDIRINGLEKGNTTGYKVNVHEVGPGIIYEDERVKVTAFEVNHGSWDQAFGYRFETPDRVIVISGDLAPSESIVEHCNGCDVLVHEAYAQTGFERSDKDWQNYLEEFHSSGTELADLATRADAKKVLIYHHLLFEGATEVELVEEIEAGFEGPVISGRDLGIY
ncbi:MAG: GDSL-type esterase/lipase family protein [Gammaproteobacteria bacterium]